MLRPGVFLDRDGVLVRPIIRDGIPYAPLRWEDFAIVPGAAAAVSELRRAGLAVVVVTNQPEVRRGNLSADLLAAFHRRLQEEVPVDAILACCHDDRDGCECRKPKPGLLWQGARDHEIDLQRAWMVGDTARDQGAARAAKVPFLLVSAPYNKDLEAEQRVPDLAAAVRVILGGGSV